MAVGSGRRPLPLFTALKGERAETSNEHRKANSKLANEGENRAFDFSYHGLGGDQSGQHAPSRRSRGAERHPDVSPGQQAAVGEPLSLLRHLGRGKLQHGEPPEASVLSLGQLRRQQREEVVSAVA